MLQDILMSTLIEGAALGQKIQNSDSVSEKGKFALDATEKNPAIEGTMAEDIANVTNTITRVKNTIDTIVALPDGSVAGDGEIAAAKIGPNGEKYTTLQDAITQQIADYKGVSVSNTEPAKSSHVDVWVNTSNEDDVLKIPQIDDTTTSEDDTWSSSKINGMFETLKTQVVDEDGNVTPLAKIIDDTDTSFDRVWSSSRTKTEILATLSNISDGEGGSINIFELIDDTSEAYNKLWSSIKVRSELNNVIDMIPDVSEVSVPAYIDDSTTSAAKIWSSNKIKAELNAVSAKIPTDTNKFNIFDYIDDSTTGTNKLWSSNKVNDMVNAAKATAYINDSSTATDKLWSANKINSAISSVKSTVSAPASSTSDGLMSAEDKKRLDALVETGNSYVLPNATTNVLGGVKVGNNISVSSGTISVATGSGSSLGVLKVGSNITVSSGTISLTKANVTAALGYTPPTENTTYTEATTSKAGLLSAADKTKLNNAAQRIIFSNKTVAVDDWADDETYSDFPFKANIACSGVTSDYVAEVIFNVTDVISGIFAPVNETGAGVISIWASEKPSDTITVPTIMCFK